MSIHDDTLELLYHRFVHPDKDAMQKRDWFTDSIHSNSVSFENGEINAEIENINIHTISRPVQMCAYDEAFTINEMVEETGHCMICSHKKCPHYHKTFNDVFKKKK